MALSASVVVSGCYVQSLNPLYSDAIVTFDADLLGRWVVEDDDEFAFTLSDRAGGTYVLIAEESGSTAPFLAVLVEIDGVKILDILPESPSSGNGFYNDHLMRVHNLLRVERSADTLRVADFDAEWLITVAGTQAPIPAHVSMNGAVLLTASTPELQAFVRRYAHTPEAFSEPVTLIRAP